MATSPNLNGRVVLVTGGARGIGEATAQALVAAGAQVAVGDLDAELAARSAAAYGGLGLPLDVTDADSFRRFADAAQEAYGRIDALVNNAGIMVIGRLLEASLEAQLKQIDINLKGVVLGCHEVAGRMVATGGGRIVNIASLAGRIPTPGSAVYSGTKAAVLALSEALDAELAPRGVRVGAVLPAFTKTAMIDGTTPPQRSPTVQPAEVGAAVVELLGRHRPVLTVPASLGFTSVQWGLLPARLKAFISRRTGMDTMFTEYDHAARAAYAQRTES